MNVMLKKVEARGVAPVLEEKIEIISRVGELVTEIFRHVYRPRMLITELRGRSLSGSAYPNNAGRLYQRRCA
jgi:hypothetical protein